jgi:CRISPR-associated exonuclease Cas4
MNITATLLNLYQVCHRQTWLHANGINMEHNSEIVADGKLLHETSYLRRSNKYTELQLDGCKIDFYDAKNKIVHEIKRGNSVEEAHKRQVQFYLHQLLKIGINATGIIEYPSMRITTRIELTEDDIIIMEKTITEILSLIVSEKCPPRLIKKTFCKTCSYFDFCWISEIDEI